MRTYFLQLSSDFSNDTVYYGLIGFLFFLLLLILFMEIRKALFRKPMYYITFLDKSGGLTTELVRILVINKQWIEMINEDGNMFKIIPDTLLSVQNRDFEEVSIEGIAEHLDTEI